MTQDDMIAQLSSGVTEVARATTPAAMFKTLLETSRFAAPRAAIFLIRKGGVQGWGSVGYTSPVASRQREFRCCLADSWLGEVCDDRGGGAISDAGNGIDFGQEQAGSRVACVLRVQERAIAVIVLERAAEELPWHPQALALMLNVGRLRLELEIANRRAGDRPAAQPESAAEKAEPGTGPITTAVVSVRHEESVPSSPPQKQPSPELDAARRYAKLVATDIRLYNEEAVMLGRKNRDLIDRLGEHIERGKHTFMERHASLGAAGVGVLHEAFVAVLAAGDESLIPPARTD